MIAETRSHIFRWRSRFRRRRVCLSSLIIQTENGEQFGPWRSNLLIVLLQTNELDFADEWVGILLRVKLRWIFSTLEQTRVQISWTWLLSRKWEIPSIWGRTSWSRKRAIFFAWFAFQQQARDQEEAEEEARRQAEEQARQQEAAEEEEEPQELYEEAPEPTREEEEGPSDFYEDIPTASERDEPPTDLYEELPTQEIQEVEQEQVVCRSVQNFNIV